MINIEQLERVLQQASERAIKLHDALDIPYVTTCNGQAVEMLHGEIIRIIEPQNTNLDLPSSN